MHRILLRVLACSIALVSLARAASADQGKGTVYFIFPCHLLDQVVSQSLKPDYGIMIDGKLRAKFTSCHFRQISVPAGKHAIRLANPGLDLGGLLTDGHEYEVPAGGSLYLMVQTTYGGGGYFFDCGPAQGSEAIAHMKKS